MRTPEEEPPRTGVGRRRFLQGMLAAAAAFDSAQPAGAEQAGPAAGDGEAAADASAKAQGPSRCPARSVPDDAGSRVRLHPARFWRRRG